MAVAARQVRRVVAALPARGVVAARPVRVEPVVHPVLVEPAVPRVELPGRTLAAPPRPAGTVASPPRNKTGCDEGPAGAGPSFSFRVRNG